MSIEINLATYDKQNEILRKLNEGGEGYFYLLASADSTAMPTDIEALKGLKNIKNIANSEAAMRAVANSSTAMNVVANSSTAMNVVANSSTAMNAVANSSTAMRAVLNSSTAMEVVGANSMATAKIVAKLAGFNPSNYANMEAVVNSSTVMNALLNSKNTKTLIGEGIITGNFLPLKSSYSSDGLDAYNGVWTMIGTELGEWLLRNSSKPIATRIKNEFSGKSITYYDLNA